MADLKLTTATQTQAINAMRFAKRANTLLKASSGGMSSGGMEAALLTQLKASIAVLSRHQKSSGGDKQQLAELEELRNLANIAVPIASTRNGKQRTEDISEAEAEAEAEAETEAGKHKDVKVFPENTGSKKIRASISVAFKSSSAGTARNQHLAAELEKEKENTYAQSQDTTSAEKIQTLLQQSKDISAQELEQEQHKHNQLLGQVSELVGSLKEATLLMNKLVVEQNEQLDQIAEVAEENMTELSDQREKMKEATKEMGSSVWTTVGTLFWLMSMFVATYVVMRMFPKPAPW